MTEQKFHVPPGALIGVFDGNGNAISGGQTMPFRTARLIFDVLRPAGYPVIRAIHQSRVIAQIPVYAASVVYGDTITLDCTGYTDLAQHAADHERRCADLEVRSGAGRYRRDAEIKMMWREVRSAFTEAAEIWKPVEEADRALRYLSEEAH